MKRKCILFLESVGGAGFLPKAPGTWGTIVAIPLAYALSTLNPLAYMGITLLIIGAGVVLAELAAPYWGEMDSPHFVLDEVAGYLVTMVWLPATPITLGAAFVLFRLFDIWKPGPIGYLERRLPGGMGVVMDDVAAGILGSVILQTLYTKTAILGVHLESLPPHHGM